MCLAGQGWHQRCARADKDAAWRCLLGGEVACHWRREDVKDVWLGGKKPCSARCTICTICFDGLPLFLSASASLFGRSSSCFLLVLSDSLARSRRPKEGGDNDTSKAWREIVRTFLFLEDEKAVMGLVVAAKRESVDVEVDKRGKALRVCVC